MSFCLYLFIVIYFQLYILCMHGNVPIRTPPLLPSPPSGLPPLEMLEWHCGDGDGDGRSTSHVVYFVGVEDNRLSFV